MSAAYKYTYEYTKLIALSSSCSISLLSTRLTIRDKNTQPGETQTKGWWKEGLSHTYTHFLSPFSLHYFHFSLIPSFLYSIPASYTAHPLHTMGWRLMIWSHHNHTLLNMRSQNICRNDATSTYRKDTSSIDVGHISHHKHIFWMCSMRDMCGPGRFQSYYMGWDLYVRILYDFIKSCASKIWMDRGHLSGNRQIKCSHSILYSLKNKRDIFCM